MEETCGEIVKTLFRPDVKYAEVITSFKNLPNEKRLKVKQSHSSFIDWLTSSDNQLDEKKSAEFDGIIRSLIKSHLVTALSVGGSMTMSEIHSYFLTSSGIVSESLLRRVANQFDNFQVTSNASDDRIKLIEQPKITINIPKVKPTSSVQPVTGRNDQLKLLYKCHPEIIVCLTPSVTWSNILKAYPFWYAHCAHSSSSLIDWLLVMARVKSCLDYPKHQMAIRLCVSQRCRMLIELNSRTIREVQHLLCITMKKLITADLIYEACCNNRHIVSISNPEKSASISCYVLQVASLSVVTTILSSSADEGTGQRCVSLSNPLLPFQPNDMIMRKLLGLVTLKIAWSNLLGNFSSLKRESPQLVDQINLHHGCLAQYLVALCKGAKTLVDPDEYETALYGQIEKLLERTLSLKMLNKLPVMTFCSNLEGLTDQLFVQKVVKAFPLRYSLLNGIIYQIGVTHMPSVYEINQNTFAMLANNLSAILAREDSQANRLADILSFVKNLPPDFTQTVITSYGTFCNFIDGFVKNSETFRKIVQHEASHCLWAKTMFAADLVKFLFGNDETFMSVDNMIKIMSTEQFIVLRHTQLGSLVARTRVDEYQNTLYLQESEDILIRAVLKLLDPEDSLCSAPLKVMTMSISDMYSTVWWSGKFTTEQREFMFYDLSAFDSNISRLYFQRFISMFPTKFTVNGLMVDILPHKRGTRMLSVTASPNSSHREVRELSVCSNSSRTGDSDRESGEVSDSDVKMQRKKRKSSKKLPDRKRKKKSRHQREKSQSSSPLKNQQSESLQAAISAMPADLIRDVARGRLLASEDNEMPISVLVNSLVSSLFTEQQRNEVNDDNVLRNAFCSKVVDCLESVNQLEVIEDLNADPVVLKVKLVLKQPPSAVSTSNVSAEPLPVFRWLSRLTGVSNRKLTTFVKAVCAVHEKPLSVDLIYLMCQQKYVNRRAYPDMSLDIINCQVTCCMIADRKIFLDAFKLTCCLKVTGQHVDQTNDLDFVFTEDESKNISTFIIDSLSRDCFSAGCSLDELVQLLIDHRPEFVDLSRDATKLLLQGLLSRLENVGFTPAGKIAKIPNEHNDKHEITSSEDSDMDLEVDLKEGDTPSPAHDVKPKDKVIDEMFTQYVEGDVIRLDQVEPKSSVTESNDALQNTLDICPSSSVIQEEPPVASEINRSNVLDVIPNAHTKSTCFYSSIPDQQRPVATIIPVAGPAPSDPRSSAKIELSDGASAPKTKRHDRRDKFQTFFVDYLSSKAFCAPTDDVFQEAHVRFANERFARSALALEAYLCDFVSHSKGLFAFGNRYGDVGVDWLFYRPRCSDKHQAQNAGPPFIDVLPDLVEFMQIHLLSTPKHGEHLAALCDLAAKRYSGRFVGVSENCHLPICRTLVLLAGIRNLDTFIFARTEPVIKLRPETLQRTVERLKRKSPIPWTPASPLESPTADKQPQTASPPKIPLTPTYSFKSKTAANRVKAIRFIAGLLATLGPCSKSELRDAWSRDAPDDVRKVLGTGVSFQLSFRKYETYFPVGDGGKVTVNENEYQKFLRENE